MIPDADELVMFDGSQSTGDTFIFEPTTEETNLGWLFAATEIGLKGGSGREVIDTVIHAVQLEYYRDSSRSVPASFESALHQANLVLHDLAEKRVRDWMNSFHASIGVLARSTSDNLSHISESGVNNMSLHVSTAGDGIVMLARSHQVNVISSGLSRSPIVDPLRTFSQVASGQILERDIIYFGTANFDQIFRKEDLSRFVADQTAATISTRLAQLYQDQKKQLPAAALVVSITAQPLIRSSRDQSMDTISPTTRHPLSLSSSLTPRKPLRIHRSSINAMIELAGRLAMYAWRQIRQVVWPYVKAGSAKGSRALFQASRSASHNVQALGKLKPFNKLPANPLKSFAPTFSPFGVRSIATIAKNIFRRLIQGLQSMPLSSKIFGVAAIIMAISLGVSVVMLQGKQATDAQIQQASEQLHEATTKKEAAETTLIYNNRDQAHQLLAEAKQLAEKVASSGFYSEQSHQLIQAIISTQDRLDKIIRLSTDTSRTIGDFVSVIPNSQPTRLFYIDNALYSYDPSNNAVVRMDQDGKVAKVSQNTQGIGFFINGTAHLADKTILFITNEPGLALYDAKNEITQKQEIEFPSKQPQITALATFGNRLYLYDQSTNNIYGYSKTLRGYTGGNPWLSSNALSPDTTIKDIAVDGYIYTLHSDGSIRKLLKGAPVEFKPEQIDPAIPGSARLLINENLRHLYIFDPANHRTVVYDTVGNLSRQIFFGNDNDIQPADIAVDPAETTLYLLAGTKVSAIPLTDTK